VAQLYGQVRTDIEPVLRNRLLIEPTGWAQTVHMFTQRFT